MVLQITSRGVRFSAKPLRMENGFSEQQGFQIGSWTAMHYLGQLLPYLTKDENLENLETLRKYQNQ